MARAAPAGQRRLRAVDGGGSGAVLRSRGFSRVGIVAHAALAIQRPGGAPDHASLLAALRSGVDAIEVDLCVTRDQHLVLRHDVKLEDGRLVDALRRREVERLEGELLTLDDAVEAVAWRSPLIIDVKSAGCAGPLGEWLARHPHTRCVVCSDDVSLLWRLRDAAPQASLMQTFPRVGSDPYERVLRVLAGLAAHRGTDALRTVRDLTGALGRAVVSPRSSLPHFSGLPWRHRVPGFLHEVRHGIGASGVTVHHSLISPQLCATAHMLDLRVVAWTVNDPSTAKRVTDCGVDLITTDSVAIVREAIAASFSI